MIVCICHRVSDRDIERAALQGCPDFEAVQDELCVGRACGACADCGQDVFDSVCARVGSITRGASRQAALVHDGMR